MINLQETNFNDQSGPKCSFFIFFSQCFSHSSLNRNSWSLFHDFLWIVERGTGFYSSRYNKDPLDYVKVCDTFYGKHQGVMINQKRIPFVMIPE